jgi:hypothetical protein
MTDEIIEIITCRRCTMQGPASKSDPHLCDACMKAENNRVSHFRQLNYNWMDVAKEADLYLWDRQPEETDREYQIWLTYRDAYPSVKPSYRLVAEQLLTTINVVKKVGSRWGFQARMQAWAKHCDEITMAQREQQILDMNKRHVTMAETLNEKLAKAINRIDPESLTPREINALMKTATELETKARIGQQHKTVAISDDENAEVKNDLVKTENMQEIIKILGTAGVLSNFGIKQTTTTEVVVKGDDN